MTESILEFVVDRLAAVPTGKGPSVWREIQASTGVPWRTTRNIALGIVRNPRYETLRRLHAYLSQQVAA